MPAAVTRARWLALVFLFTGEGQGFLDLAGLEQLGQLGGHSAGRGVGLAEEQMPLDEEIKGQDGQCDQKE